MIRQKKALAGTLSAFLLLSACGTKSPSPQADMGEIARLMDAPASVSAVVTTAETSAVPRAVPRKASRYTPEPEEVRVFAEVDRLVAELVASYSEEVLLDDKVNELFLALEKQGRSLDDWLNKTPIYRGVDPDRAEVYAAHHLTLSSSEGVLYALVDSVAIGEALEGKVTPAYESYFDLMTILEEKKLFPLFVEGSLIITEEELVEAVALIEPFYQEHRELAQFHYLAGMQEYAKTNYGHVLKNAS